MVSGCATILRGDHLLFSVCDAYFALTIFLMTSVLIHTIMQNETGISSEAPHLAYI